MESTAPFSDDFPVDMAMTALHWYDYPLLTSSGGSMRIQAERKIMPHTEMKMPRRTGHHALLPGPTSRPSGSR